MQDNEKVFAQGFSFKRNDNAPDFVIGQIALKVADAIAFIKQHDKNGWVNLSVKQARSGNYYIELDTFEPKKKQGAPARPSAWADKVDDDIPF